jgi:7-cyano-7-deazaguanine synthase
MKKRGSEFALAYMPPMTKASRTTVTVLFSGGIDSSGCISFYVRQRIRIRPLFVDYGQPASRAERKSAYAVCSFYGLSLHVISLKGLKVPRSGEILGRNLLLVSAALIAAGFETNLIALGIHRGTRYFDCGPGFIKLCERLFEGYTDGQIRIAAPFLKMNKAEVWEYCKQNHVPLRLTWSCEASCTRPCTKCLSCKDKESLLARA